jgi:hypothetical protein
LRTTFSGVCFFLVAMLMSSLPAHNVGRKTLNGGSGDQLGQPQHDQPDRDQAAMVQQRRQMPVDQGDEAVAGILTQLLGRQPGEVAWGSKLGTAKSTPTTISFSPRTAL